MHDNELLAAKSVVKKVGIPFILATIFLVASLLLFLIASGEKSDLYQQKVSVSSATPLLEKISSYKEAVEIFPGKPEAYMKMLEAYEEENSFDLLASADFLGIYNAHTTAFDMSDPETAKLNFMAGTMYLSVYTGSGEATFTERVQKAYSFFAANESYEGNPYIEESASHCLYNVCLFYKSYILTPSAKEVPAEDYLLLYRMMQDSVSSADQLEAHYQLTLYQACLELLYSQRSGFAVSGVQQSELSALIDSIDERAQNLTVRNDRLRAQRESVLKNVEQCKEEIQKAYAIAEKGNS